METADADEIIVPLCIIIICAGLHQLQQQARRRFWVRPWITRRSQFGAYHSLIRELSDEDEKGYKNFLRMDMDSFNELLHLVEPHIKRQDSLMRQSISPAERLALTLRFLATGNRFLFFFCAALFCGTLQENQCNENQSLVRLHECTGRC